MCECRFAFAEEEQNKKKTMKNENCILRKEHLLVTIVCNCCISDGSYAAWSLSALAQMIACEWLENRKNPIDRFGHLYDAPMLPHPCFSFLPIPAFNRFQNLSVRLWLQRVVFHMHVLVWQFLHKIYFSSGKYHRIYGVVIKRQFHLSYRSGCTFGKNMQQLHV